MSTEAQIEANRRNAQKSTGPKTPEGKARSRRNGLTHGLAAQACMLEDEDPADLLKTLEDLREKYDPQDTDEDFLIERMARARFRYGRIMPLEAAIYNLRLAVDKAPAPLVEAQGIPAQRAWAYMRDANGGNALSKLSRYENTLLREYDRSRQELEKLQKIRAAQAAPPPGDEDSQSEPNFPISLTKRKVSRSTRKPAGAPARTARSRKSTLSYARSTARRAGKVSPAAHRPLLSSGAYGTRTVQCSSKPAHPRLVPPGLRRQI